MNEDYTKVFIRDLEIAMFIGVYEHEKAAPQPVVVNVELALENRDGWQSDDLETTVSYEDVVSWIREIARQAHINLVETFAEKIAQRCLLSPAARSALVRIEKPAILENTRSAGVEILRVRAS